MVTHLIALQFAWHFIADFILQTKDIAENKSTSLSHLALHASHHFGVFTLGNLLTVSLWKPEAQSQTVIVYAVAIATVHALIDACTWNSYKLFRSWLSPNTVKGPEDHMFWNTLGFDQLLHGLTILYVFNAFFAL